MVKRHSIAFIALFYLFVIGSGLCHAETLQSDYSIPSQVTLRDSLEYAERYIHTLPTSGSSAFSVLRFSKDDVEYQWQDINCEILLDWVKDDSFSAAMTHRECEAPGALAQETVHKIVDVYNGRLKERLFVVLPPVAIAPGYAADSTNLPSIADSSKAPSTANPPIPVITTDKCAYSDSLGKADALKKSLWLSTGCVFTLSATTGPLVLLFAIAVPALDVRASPPKTKPPNVIPACYDDAYVKMLGSRKFRNHFLAFLSGIAILAAVQLEQ